MNELLEHGRLDRSEIPELTRIDGWGGIATMTTQQAGKQPGLQADRLSGASLYTVQFSVSKPVLAGSNGIFAAIAVIDWLVAGTPIRRRISVTDGKSISGVGQGVVVSCYDVTPDLGQVADAPYKVNITVARGSRPAQGQPPTLSLFDQQFQAGNAIPAAGSEIVEIPQNSGAISVEIVVASTDPLTDANVLIQHVSDDGANVYKTYRVTDGPQEFVPIADGATQIIITNLSAGEGSNPVNVSVTYGIDG
jgi:hypothetical protein